MAPATAGHVLLDDWPRMATVYQDLRRALLTIGEADGDQWTRSDMAVACLAQRHEDSSPHGLHTLDVVVASILRSSTFFEVLQERCSDYAFAGAAHAPWDPPKIVPFLYNGCSGSILVRVWYLPSEDLLSRLRRHEHSQAQLLAALEPYSTRAFALQPRMSYNTDFDEVLHPDQFVQPLHLAGEATSHVLHIAIERASDARDPVVLSKFDHAVLELEERLRGSAAATVQSGDPKRTSCQPRRYRLRLDHAQVHYFLATDGGENVADAVLELESHRHYAAREELVSVDWSLYELDLCSTFHPANRVQGAQAIDARAPAEKGKMTDAKAVMSRVRHDPAIHGNDIVVHYLDRHEGLMSKRFSEWQSETTDDEFIPTHRIRIVTRAHDGAVLWDRARRIDTFRKI